MSKIEKIFYDWSNDQVDSEDLRAAYAKVSDVLADLLGFEKFNEIEDFIMECVLLERLAAFKGGFQQATAIWKECT